MSAGEATREPQVHSRFVELQGKRVHLLESGAGPALVHLHGTSTNAESHRPLLECLPDLHSLAVDRPGNGQTTGPPMTGPRYRRQVVDFLDSLLDALRLPSVSLAGASGGGVWALWYAMERPDRVDALVLLGATPGLPGTRAPLPIRLTAVPLLGEVIDRMIPASRPNVIRFMTAMGEGDTITRYPALLDSQVAARADRAAVAAARAEFRTFLAPSGDWRPEARTTPTQLAQVKASTLLVWGEHDPLGGPDAAGAVAHALPRGHLELLPYGHVPWLGDPNRVAQLVTRHVAAAVDNDQTRA